MSNSPWFVSTQAIREVVTWADAVEAMRAIYAIPHDPAEVPPRSIARRGKTWLRSLSAVLPTGTYMGAKLFGLSRQRSVTYLVSLFDQETGELACLLDGDSLTAYRTAATSAAALDHLAAKKPLKLGVLGSGTEAHSHIRAIAAIRPIAGVAIFSPSEANRTACAATFTKELGVPCHAAATARDAVTSCDVVVAAARSRDETPTFQSSWITDGTLVISIGSTLPEQREVETALIARASRIVVDAVEEVTESTGDFIAAKREGIAFHDKIVALNDLLSGKATLGGGSGLVMFKSVGSAVQDLAIAELAFNRARERGLATTLDASFSLKTSSRR